MSQDYEMTTALATTNGPERRIAPMAVGATGAIVRSFDDLARLSTMICKSGLAPRDMNTPEKIGVAIMWGMEVGLSPVQAIQNIAVINGRPCMWGDALPALVLSSSVCEYVTEELKGEGDAMVAVCTSKRRNSPREVTKAFSVADAKKAGLWGKAGPWQNYPKRMLQIRARALNFRDNFADVLRGMNVSEEMSDIAVTAASVSDAMPAAPEVAQPQTSELDDYAATELSPSPTPAPVSATAQAPSEPPIDVTPDAADLAGEAIDPRPAKERAKEWVAAQSEPDLRAWVNSQDIVNTGLAVKTAKVEGVTAAHPFKCVQKVAYVLKLAELEIGAK